MRRTVVFLPTLSLSLCFLSNVPEMPKKKKGTKMHAASSAFYLHFNFALDDGRRRTLWRLQSQLHSANCTAVQSKDSNRQLPRPRTGTSQDQYSQDAQESPDSDLDSDFYCDSRQVLLTAILCWKMSFRAYQRLTSDRSQPKNNGQDGHTQRENGLENLFLKYDSSILT